MLILADNDVGGAVAALRYVLTSAEWVEFTTILDLRFVTFADVGLSRDASDEAAQGGSSFHRERPCGDILGQALPGALAVELQHSDEGTPAGCPPTRSTEHSQCHYVRCSSASTQSASAWDRGGGGGG